MTRHTYRPGGATYYPMDGSRQGDPLEPDDVIAALDAHMERREEPTERWSDWLEWRGAKEDPLPPDTHCQAHTTGFNYYDTPVDCIPWDAIKKFRYRADNPAGWLPRGDWIPPAELWDEGCPVRCEWTYGLPVKWAGRARLDAGDWDGITHIRLVARQPQTGLPEGFRIDEDGALWSEFGPVLNQRERERYTPAAIRQAVDAWLR